MNKLLKSISMCSMGVACALLLATAKASATNYRVSPAEGLNVRASAGVSGQWIGALPVGTVVDVQAISNGWGRINYNGRDGWVCMEYLSLVSTAKQTYQVADSDGLNVRTGPGTGYDRLGAICVGTNVDVTDTHGNWGRISYGGRDGWICLDYARKVSSSVAPSSAVRSGFVVSDRLVNFVAVSEGFCGSVSADNLVSGVRQIGYGHVVQAGERCTSMSEAQARDLLRRDLNDRGARVNEFLRNNGITANQQQFDALVSFTYNLGTGWMSDADIMRVIHTAGNNLSRVNRDAFAREFLAYHHVYNPGRCCVIGLLSRRIDEMNVFFYGDYTRRYHENPYGYPIPACIAPQWNKK